jgi:hypothetical protein
VDARIAHLPNDLDIFFSLFLVYSALFWGLLDVRYGLKASRRSGLSAIHLARVPMIRAAIARAIVCFPPRAQADMRPFELDIAISKRGRFAVFASGKMWTRTLVHKSASPFLSALEAAVA